MGGQITTIPQGQAHQSLHSQHKVPNHPNHPENQAEKPVFEFRRVSEVLKQLQRFKQEQQKIGCKKRIEILSKIVQMYDDEFQKKHSNKNPQQLFQKYLQNYVLPTLNRHQQFCYSCTGRHWQVEQWNVPYSQVTIEQSNHHQTLKFTIPNPQQKTDHLDVIIYKYLQSGNGYLKEDKVRNMKIFKKPLSEWQLTNLVFQHQYLIVQCQNSYWSFEKDSKRLIVQASILLTDVRDKILGQKRIEEIGFTWFGLRKKWFPQVMYQSNQICTKNIKDVRAFAESLDQKSLKYNVFSANCKIYAQYIMKNCITESSWKENQTFFDFFNT